MIYDKLLSEARLVSQFMGTWVLHSLMREKDPARVSGYITGRIADFERRSEWRRAHGGSAQANRRVKHWRRAARLVDTLATAEHGRLCARLLKDLSTYPYSSVEDVEPTRVDMMAKLDCAPPRKGGRPRTSPAKSIDLDMCQTCMGQGWLPK